MFFITIIIHQAIGLRMAKEAEEEKRHGQQKAMQAIINEKKAELDRYTVRTLFYIQVIILKLLCRHNTNRWNVSKQNKDHN